jgi:hypothetical protein
MRKLLILIFGITLFTLLPLNTSAYYCDFVNLSRLKKIASNVNFYTTSYREGEKMYFEVTFSNFHPELVLNNNSNADKYYPTDNKLVLEKLEDGKSYSYTILTDETMCLDKSLRNIYINLPKYNYFSELAICDGVEDFDLCKKWNSNTLSSEEFVKKVQAYKDSLKEEEPKEEDPITDNLILKFYLDYYYVILPSFIAINLLIIYYLDKKDDFDLKV